ncbi:epoxide hydrolase, partial [Podila epigama]
SLGDSFVSIHETTTRHSSVVSHHHHQHSQSESKEKVILDTDKDNENNNDKGEDDLTVPRRLELSARQSDLVAGLRARLATARFPDQIENAGWDYGSENGAIKALTREWLHHYDWDKELNVLNSDFEHWTCNVDGLDVHYVRHDPWAAEEEERDEALAGRRQVNDKGEIIMPLMLIHGWPGTWYEFVKVIPLLKERGRFQIIVPSLPGFGWSQ